MQHPLPADPFTGPLGLNAMAMSFGVSPLVFGLIFAVVSVWTIAIKGYALWHAAQNGQKGWFIALLILNTFGILEIVYLLFFRPKEEAVAAEEKTDV